MYQHRYLEKFIQGDLTKKMVFIGGPRQVGKTTMAKQVSADFFTRGAYLNWDIAGDRKNIIGNRLPGDADLLIFDEIHKFRFWKNFVKGLYDSGYEDRKILVTGSSRLDLYRRGSDSLQGRYFYYRLHPFTLRELLQKPPELQVFAPLLFLTLNRAQQKKFDNLLRFGGFPEPLFARSEIVLRRFHNNRLERLVREDIRDLESIRDIGLLQFLAGILPNKVGSLLSLNALREDLKVAFKTVRLWMDILEKFYYHFRLYPFSASQIKALRKEPKMYLWDWSELNDQSARIENMVALHLLKTAHFLYDSEGRRAELFFLRDREGREVDFLLTVDKKPWLAVEVKQNDKEPSPYLKYFGERLKIPFQYQVVLDRGTDFLTGRIRVISMDKFLSGLI